jgi:diguanylate cyclase (GGDEF)-like protein
MHPVAQPDQRGGEEGRDGSVPMERRASDRQDPLSRESLFRQVGALVGAVLLGFLSMAVREVAPERTGMLVQASTVTAATVIVTLIVPWGRLPNLAHTFVPFVFLVVAFLARQATGGAESAYAQLALLPVLWVAVYGTLRELGAIVLAAAALLTTPLFDGGANLALVQTMAMMFGGGAVALMVHRFFDRLRRQTNRLQVFAGTDPLTGAANRRAWDEELAAGLVRASRDGLPLAAALIDLDDFKGFNDRFGHQAGDRLLKEAAAAWRNTLRASDVLARIGGDEFAVLLPGGPLDMAATIAERLRGAVPETAGCSVGVAVWNGREAGPQFVARADRALYDAKERGRDCVVVIGENDDAVIEVREEREVREEPEMREEPEEPSAQPQERDRTT